MDDTGQFNDKRLSGNDYSKPGTYHLLFELGEHASTLGSMCKGTMTLNAYGEIFLSVLGMALQIFSCLRLDAMDIRPKCVELVVSIIKWRKPFLSRFMTKFNRWHYRRTMTISVFAGYLKMNSGRSINTKRKRSGEHFWTLGFKDRVLTDKDEINEVCARLNAGFRCVRCSAKPVINDKRAVTLVSAIATALGAAVGETFGALFSDAPAASTLLDAPVRPHDTMLLGRALFLNSELLRPLSPDGDAALEAGSEASGACGGRTESPLIFGVGPGRIFLTVPPEN